MFPTTAGRAIKSPSFRSKASSTAAKAFSSGNSITPTKDAEAGNLKALVIRVNSPGGTISGSDYMLHHLQEFKKKTKVPIVVSMGAMAASGGYYVSMAVGDTPDSIFAEPTTWTGSIGVIIPHYNLAGLMKEVGIEEDEVTSHRLKGMGSIARPMTEEEKEDFPRTGGRRIQAVQGGGSIGPAEVQGRSRRARQARHGPDFHRRSGHGKRPGRSSSDSSKTPSIGRSSWPAWRRRQGLGRAIQRRTDARRRDFGRKSQGAAEHRLGRAPGFDFAPRLLSLHLAADFGGKDGVAKMLLLLSPKGRGGDFSPSYSVFSGIFSGLFGFIHSGLPRGPPGGVSGGPPGRGKKGSNDFILRQIELLKLIVHLLGRKVQQPFAFVGIDLIAFEKFLEILFVHERTRIPPLSGGDYPARKQMQPFRMVLHCSAGCFASRIF